MGTARHSSYGAASQIYGLGTASPLTDDLCQFPGESKMKGKPIEEYYALYS